MTHQTRTVRYDMNELAKSEPAQSQAYRGEFECPFCGKAGHIIETDTDVAESQHCEHAVSVGNGVAEFYRDAGAEVAETEFVECGHDVSTFTLAGEEDWCEVCQQMRTVA